MAQPQLKSCSWPWSAPPPPISEGAGWSLCEGLRNLGSGMEEAGFLTLSFGK